MLTKMSYDRFKDFHKGERGGRGKAYSTLIFPSLHHPLFLSLPLSHPLLACSFTLSPFRSFSPLLLSCACVLFRSFSLSLSSHLSLAISSLPSLSLCLSLSFSL